MNFTSLEFALFLPLVFALYWMVPTEYRWIVLLCANYSFYISWNYKFAVILAFLTCISFFSALILEKAKDRRKQKIVWLSTIALCVGSLCFYKYLAFIIETVGSVLGWFHVSVKPLSFEILMPLGISFYTFQTIAYLTDIYMGRMTAEHHFGRYAVYLSFFPCASCGPIERANAILPQIKNEIHFNYDQATYGLKRMALGYFKKVIADALAQYVNVVFSKPQQYQGFALILASALFSIQIYCDFSGYTDLAVGTAKLVGIDLVENFKSPYFAQSIKEFWSRWHISLSTWFRDYVYIPLGGNRVGRSKYCRNILITFLISGLWHGANWTFIVWGCIHGLAQVAESYLVPKDKMRSNGILKWIRIVGVFAFCTCTWVFFKSQSIKDAFYIFLHSFKGIRAPLDYFYTGLRDIGILGSKTSIADFCLTVACIMLLSGYDYFSQESDLLSEVSHKPVLARWSLYVVFSLMVVFLSEKGVSTEFVYAQF